MTTSVAFDLTNDGPFVAIIVFTILAAVAITVIAFCCVGRWSAGACRFLFGCRSSSTAATAAVSSSTPFLAGAVDDPISIIV